MVIRVLLLILLYGYSNALLAIEWTQSSPDGRVQVILELPENDVLIRQFRMLQYKVYSNDAFITLDVEKSKYLQSHLQLLPVRKQLSPDPKWKYQYQLNVLSYFTINGKKQYQTPVLRYSEGGRIRYQFNFSPVMVNVKPLPPYLPPYIPMGRLELESRLPGVFNKLRPAVTDHVYYWNIYIRGKNISKDALPELRQQIRSNRQIKFLPASVTRSVDKQHNYLVQTLHYSIPFMIKQSGFARFPDLRLQYFDPGTGLMRVRMYQTGTGFVLNMTLQWLGIILMLSFFIGSLMKIRPYLLRVYFSLILLMQGRKQLRQAQTAEEIRQSMRLLGQAFGWSENLSLSCLQSYWQAKITDKQDVQVSLSRLSRALYSPKAVSSLDGIKKTFLCHGFSQARVCLYYARQASMEPSQK